MRLLVSVCAVLLMACPSASRERPPVSTSPVVVIRNAKIFTAAEPRWADAIAIRDDRILSVGTAEQVEREARAATSSVRIIDAGGRVVVPGFNDAHYHGGTYPGHEELDAGGQEPSFDAVVSTLTEAVKTRPAGTWLVVPVGGAVFADPRATRATLDGITTTHPVTLSNWGGHSSIFNSAALAALGFDDQSATPRGGKIRRDAQGKLDGRFEEYANYLAARRFAGLAKPEEQVARYQKVAALFLKRGLTSAQDMAGIRPADELAAALPPGSLPFRWRLIRMPVAGGDTLDMAADRAPGHSGVKWILDGTPVEAGAAMTAAYADGAGKGLLNFSAEEVRRFLVDAAAANDQPMFHAVGDAAIDQVLDAMEATGGAARWAQVRVRLEHADLIRQDQLERCRALGVVVVQNPAHLMTVEMMRKRYGARADAIQPLKSLLAAGVPLAIGSDGPTNPFLNLMFLTMHPVSPGEALTREEAVIAYTRGSAYAEHAEREKGTLMPGMLADLAVLSDDIFTIPPPALPKTTSVLTMVGGKIVHDAGVIAQ